MMCALLRLSTLLLLAVLTLAGASPARATLTVNGDGTVTDSDTGLVWDRCSVGQTGSDCSGNSASTYTWAQALGTAVSLRNP